MTDIASPKRTDDYTDRGIDCQFAMEPAFQALLRQAEATGWTEDDVAYAVLELAGNNIKGIIADSKTEKQIAVAKWMGPIRQDPA